MTKESKLLMERMAGIVLTQNAEAIDQLSGVMNRVQQKLNKELPQLFRQTVQAEMMKSNMFKYQNTSRELPSTRNLVTKTMSETLKKGGTLSGQASSLISNFIAAVYAPVKNTIKQR